MTPEEIAAMKAENERLKKEADDRKKKDDEVAAATAKKAEEEKKKADGSAGAGADLNEKARLEREATAKKEADTKEIEAAVTFTLGVDAFLKENADVIPSTMADVVKVADREKYGSKAERANVIKAAFIKEFFSLQENVDQLTPAQKRELEDFNRLTVTAKQERAAHVYENIFEPSIATLKKVKKAEEVGKARVGLATGSGAADAMVKKISSLSSEFYLGKKETV
jgi:hypothetical protein